MQNNLSTDTRSLLDGLASDGLLQSSGRVCEVAGITIKSVGPVSSIGDIVNITREGHPGGGSVRCEVVGFRDQFVLLMPVDQVGGIRPGDRVTPVGHMTVRAGRHLLGRIVDGMGHPIDGGPPLIGGTPVPIDRQAPAAMSRNISTDVFATGVKAIDGLLTTARGQRVGIFAGSGVGKSVLLGALARNASARVNVVALIGERGREVRDFVERVLGPEGLAKSVVVAVTSDQSPVMRVKGAATAMAIAENFRDQGEDVLFLMDSVTRCAMAQREIGLAIGEPPTTKGYPPSVFGVLSRLLERSGMSDRGSITGFFTVLVEADDLNDPVADAVRATLDGHVVLSRKIAMANHYPAIDVLNSVSRLMNEVTAPTHRELAAKFRTLLSTYAKAEDLINIGAYVNGANPRIDEALRKIDRMQEFLRQPFDRRVAVPETLTLMEKALA